MHSIFFPKHVWNPFFPFPHKFGIVWFKHLIGIYPLPPLHTPPPENSARRRRACVASLSSSPQWAWCCRNGGVPAPTMTSDTDTNHSKSTTTHFSQHKGLPEPASLSLYKEFYACTEIPTKHKVVGYTENCLELVFPSHTNNRVIVFFFFCLCSIKKTMTAIVQVCLIFK